MSALQLPSQPPSSELRRDRRIIAIAVLALAAAAAAVLYSLFPFRGPTELLHVSYDASREFYAELNKAYAEQAGETAASRIVMNHAGSTRQAANLAHGQIADIASLASEYDLDIILSGNSCISGDWRQSFPHGSSPFYSTISIVTRAGNPKRIAGWSDLWRNDVKLALPSPSASGAGRWAFLALYAEALTDNPDPQAARARLQNLFLRCELLDAGARRSLHQFSRSSQADALLTWESEALRLGDIGHANLTAVFPERSILAEPRIALMPCHVENRDTGSMARDYLDFHYAYPAQRIAASHGLRPRVPAEVPGSDTRFPETQLYKIDDAFPEKDGIWQSAYGENGLFPYLHGLRFAYRGGSE